MIDTALKFLDDAGNRVGGYLVVYGDSDHRDLDDEYFTNETNFFLDWFDKRPLLYQHGLDGVLKSATIGVIDTLKQDINGLWMEAQLDMRNQYVEMVRDLIRQGALGQSSGSIPHLVEVARDGHIRSWPIAEGSLTPTPAEPRTSAAIMKHTSDAATIEAAYKSVGLTLPADLVSTDGAIESADGKDGAEKQPGPRTIKIVRAKTPIIKIRG